ncbi:hypothetical protein FPS98_20040 [Brevibacillus brevis]|uniref:Uncharacterized protein n=2 Tax=Brevibacillus brevis TaxID=1393 RepID=A0A517IH16_BREBE|nr:hypothetical protein FPS98_20040 [Brevibacillus brevis]
MSLSKQPENARLASDNDEEYYQYIEGGLGKGYGYRVQGPKITYVDAGNNYSFRWKTDVDDIEKMLKEDGLNYTGAHDISQFRLRIYTRDPLVFNTVTPISDSEEEFEVPMYFGKTIGVAPIPVVVKSVEITGSGTDDLLYDFNWSSATWPSSAYLDERSWNTDPGNKPGFAVRYTMDTPPTIDPGKVKINFNGYFKYRSKVNKYSLLINHFTEITEKDFYSIEIVE